LYFLHGVILPSRPSPICCEGKYIALGVNARAPPSLDDFYKHGNSCYTGLVDAMRHDVVLQLLPKSHGPRPVPDGYLCIFMHHPLDRAMSYGSCSTSSSTSTRRRTKIQLLSIDAGSRTISDCSMLRYAYAIVSELGRYGPL